MSDSRDTDGRHRNGGDSAGDSSDWGISFYALLPPAQKLLSLLLKRSRLG